MKKQSIIQYWLGLCYFEWAMQTRGGKQVAELFERAIKCYQQALELVEQLENEGQQGNAQFLLGLCYFEWAMQTKGDEQAQATKLFETASEHYQQWRLQAAVWYSIKMVIG